MPIRSAISMRCCLVSRCQRENAAWCKGLPTPFLAFRLGIRAVQTPLWRHSRLMTPSKRRFGITVALFWHHLLGTPVRSVDLGAVVGVPATPLRHHLHFGIRRCPRRHLAMMVLGVPPQATVLSLMHRCDASLGDRKASFLRRFGAVGCATVE